MKSLKKRLFRLGVILCLTLSLVGCKGQPPVATVSGPGVEEILVEEIQVEEIIVNEITVKPVEVKPSVTTWDDVTTYWD